MIKQTEKRETWVICGWDFRVVKNHGVLLYELDHKKYHYPTRRHEEAVNPDGTRLR